MYSREEVLQIVKQNNVNIIQLWFVDILGFLKTISISARELPSAFEHGKGFDGSSITGFAEAEESDLLAWPDPSTFAILPWCADDQPIARMFCDITYPNREPYPGDPRYVMRRMKEKAKEMGFVYCVGPELEYFYFKSPGTTEVLDWGGYFELIPHDLADSIRNKTIQVLERMGIPVEATHHEVSPSQHEIDIRFCEALEMADRVITAKVVIKELALQNGVYATFMPKPLEGVNGSGMHIHQSLFKDGRNAFFDPNSEDHLSDIAKKFIAGQLFHAREYCGVTSQWVNSYKRLVPGYEAPVYVSWARRNRTTMIRVPDYRPGNEEATRAEIRCPDPACNPYLAFAVLLAAGLRGIEKNYQLPPPVEANIYGMGEDERMKRQMQELPVSLYSAMKEIENSELVREVLGDHIFNKFLANKYREWDEYRTQVTPLELKKGLASL